MDGPFAGALNRATRHVASTTLTRLGWENSVLIEGDVPASVAALKAREGPELQVHGSSGLIRTLLPHGLIDAFRVLTFPLVLGTGRRLFGAGTAPAGLELVDSEVSSTGVITATYRTGAPIRSGSFAPDRPSEAELARRAALAEDEART